MSNQPPWIEDEDAINDEGVVLKPWEHGFSVDKLPKSPAPKRSRMVSEAQRQKMRENFEKNGLREKMMQNRSPEERSEMATKSANTRISNQKTVEGKTKEIMTRAENGTLAKSKFASAEEKLEQHKFDPMDLLLSVAKGEALQVDHPFLPKLIEYLAEIEHRIDFDDGFGVKGLLDQLRVDAINYLQDKYTPKEQRVKVATELLQYVRPKLKQVEQTKEEAPTESGHAQPLTEEEVKNFKEWFDKEY